MHSSKNNVLATVWVARNIDCKYSSVFEITHEKTTMLTRQMRGCFGDDGECIGNDTLNPGECVECVIVRTSDWAKQMIAIEKIREAIEKLDAGPVILTAGNFMDSVKSAIKGLK